MTVPAPPTMRYLLDTNIVIAYGRRNRLSQQIEARYDLLSTARGGRAAGDLSVVPVVSIVTAAEALALALDNNWGAYRMNELRDLINQFATLPVEGQEQIERYVQIALFSRRSGVTMGKNDLWIAVAASLTGATLLTTDRDFDHLDGLFLRRVWVDPAAATP